MKSDWLACPFDCNQEYRSLLFLFLHDIRRCFLSNVYTRKNTWKWICNWKKITACIIPGAQKKTKQIDRLKGDKFLFFSFVTLPCLRQGVKFNIWQVCEKRMNNYYYDHYNLLFNSIISDFHQSNERTNERKKNNVKK